MGEYAYRRPDGEHIKIGTCEDMYYIRYEDRKKVKPDEHSLDCSKELEIRWRLPFPDEDYILPGNYMDHNRSEPLYDFDAELGPDYQPGTFLLSHESGIRVNVPCYHGKKLPENTGDLDIGWTNKKDHFILSSVKNTKDEGMMAVVKCKVCGEMWRFKLETVIDHIHDPELKERISNYQDI